MHLSAETLTRTTGVLAEICLFLLIDFPSLGDLRPVESTRAEFTTDRLQSGTPCECERISDGSLQSY